MHSAVYGALSVAFVIAAWVLHRLLGFVTGNLLHRGAPFGRRGFALSSQKMFVTMANFSKLYIFLKP